jgi:hypothetical protein
MIGSVHRRDNSTMIRAECADIEARLRAWFDDFNATQEDTRDGAIEAAGLGA